MKTNTLNRNDRILSILLTPIFALCNLTFYKTLLLTSNKVRGFSYLLILSLILSVPMSFKIKSLFSTFNDMGFSQMVAKLPSSYLDTNGTLHPQDDATNLLYVKNKQGNLFIVYNTNDETLDSSLNPFFEIRSKYLKLKANDEYLNIPWSAFSTSPMNINSTDASFLLDKVLNSSFLSIFLVISMWLFLVVAFNALIVGLLSLLALKFITPRLKLKYSHTLTCACYSNTLVLLIMTLQFFIYLPISFNMMAIISFSYVVFAGFYANKDILNTLEKVNVYMNTQKMSEDIKDNTEQNGSNGSFKA